MAGDRTYVKEADGLVRIGNGLVELGFDAARGGALASILDPKTGWRFVRHARAAAGAPAVGLARVALRRKADRELEWLDTGAAERFSWQAHEGSDGARTLALRCGGFPRAGLSLSVEVTLEPGSALSAWRLTVDGVGEDAVFQAVYPLVGGVLKVGAGAPGEAIAVPRQGEGYVFHDPFPVVDNLPLKAGPGPESPSIGAGEIHGMYPGGYPIQLLLYYTETAGLYIASHDAGQHVKGFDVGPVPSWNGEPVMSVSHYPTESPGQGVRFDYPTILGVFHGDWYDGADIYKGWARKQWWCAKSLAEKDVAPWVRNGFAVFQMQNYDSPVLTLTHPMEQIAEIVNRVSKDSGVPMLGLVFNFENGGAWTGPKGFFPPREGEEPFRRGMDTMRAAGNRGFVYMPGGNWYIAIDGYTPPFDSWEEFEKEGRPVAVLNAKGEVSIPSWYQGWHATRICPHTPYTREETEELILGCVRRGCPVVQVDNFPICNADACYDPNHGHPIGYGPWWSEDWNAILEGVRRKAKAIDPDATLTTEGISEGFIPHLDLYDQRAGNMEYFGHYQPGDPMGGELIPIFGYLYGGYIGAYTAAYPECSRPEVLYWARCFGKALAQGVVPGGGWYLPEPQCLNPKTMAIFHRVARAAAQECWKYIFFGEMLRPPRIEVPELDFAYVRILDLIDFPKRHPELRHVVRDKAVQNGSFRARDGTVGHVFVNVSDQEVSFAAPLGAYGSSAHRFSVDGVFDGVRRPLRRGAGLPLSLPLTLPAFSVLLVEVTEEGA